MPHVYHMLLLCLTVLVVVWSRVKKSLKPFSVINKIQWSVDCGFLFPPTQGFIRVFNDMTDIVLDAPNAYHTLSKFVEKGMEAGFVTQMIAEQVPNRYISQFI